MPQTCLRHHKFPCQRDLRQRCVFQQLCNVIIKDGTAVMLTGNARPNLTRVINLDQSKFRVSVSSDLTPPGRLPADNFKFSDIDIYLFLFCFQVKDMIIRMIHMF